MNVQIDKREQVAHQCLAIAHLCDALARVRRDYVQLIRTGHVTEEFLDEVGAETARQMELLGDILNGMDAVGEGDEWLTPVFNAAHRLWPEKAAP